MRYRQTFIPTLREDPAEAEVISHKLLLRAGMMRQVARGIYDFLPLGLRVVRKVENIVREEMNRAGAQEILMPALCPAELWQESGRWDVYGRELLRIKDRHKRDFCFGPTHEEVVTDIVRGEIRSYRDLPLNLYQIQTKFRDEVRPRFGLMRGREFIMKDAYSFHTDLEDCQREYQNMYDAYGRIFDRCGLTYRPVEADTGAIGGSMSHEFQVLADSGEDAIVSCDSCDYAANVEKAELAPPSGPLSTRSASLTKVDTPDQRTIEEVSSFLGEPPERFIKTLLYVTDNDTVVAALVRGDHELSEPKLKNVLGCQWVVLADEETANIVGYYTLSSLSVRIGDLPEETQAKLPKYPNVPAALLGRLAVDLRYQGQGHGEMLLFDALNRALTQSQNVAIHSVVVETKGEDAERFYERYGFIHFPSSPRRMFIPMGTVAKMFT